MEQQKQMHEANQKLMQTLMQNILQTNHKSNQPQPNQGYFQQNDGPGGQKKQFKYEDWQTEKKGNSIQREGGTWWWCPQHNEGKGLYVRTS